MHEVASEIGSDEARSTTVATSPPHDRLTLTVEEFARSVGIGRGLAYESVRSGVVPSVKIGRRILVPKIAVDRWLGGVSFGAD